MPEAVCLADRPVWMLVFAVAGGLASATMVNAPAFMIGYGLTYPVMLLAAWMFRPSRAALVVLGAMLVAFPFYVLPRSVFPIIAVFTIVLRPTIVYVASRVYRTHGKLGSALALTALETSFALGIGVLVFGFDGIEEGLTVFGFLFAIFCFAVYSYAGKKERVALVGFLAAILAMLGYYISFVAYVVPYTLIPAGIALIALLVATRRETWRPKLVYAALIIAILAPTFGGVHLTDNIVVATYPFNPASWSGSAWAQTNPSCPASANVLANVHDPARLRIVNPCVSVTGVVGLTIVHETDGDFTFFLKPLPSNHTTLALSNYVFWGGYIHPEVVPGDQHAVLDPIGGGVCPGDTLRVTGALVLDTDHGTYSEIHPVYGIQILDSNGTWPSCVVE